VKQIELTQRQLRVLEFIQAYIKMKGFAPSMQDVATGLGLKSRSNIHRIVRYLEDNGLLTTVPHKFRTIKLRDRSVEKMLAL
jgi:repressor LexA